MKLVSAEGLQQQVLIPSASVGDVSSILLGMPFIGHSRGHDHGLDPDFTVETGVRSPMEAHGSFRGEPWTPERLIFHQNLETFAERVGLIVGLQANGKLSQEEAYAQIKKIWKVLKQSKGELINGRDS